MSSRRGSRAVNPRSTSSRSQLASAARLAWEHRLVAAPWNIVLGLDEGIHNVITRVPIQALTHMIVGPIALLVGPLQWWRTKAHLGFVLDETLRFKTARA